MPMLSTGIGSVRLMLQPLYEHPDFHNDVDFHNNTDLFRPVHDVEY